ncbi:hypothetical protein Dxin01_00789 [Deinococcus xinjiangensis]|uniref:Uncharacterized protein n=1 Tax=Deinococcus xinjiangensis TaxID=457454 RepID=A0ABP9V6Z5_9DEIO
MPELTFAYGWDAPLQYYYFTAYDGDEVVYSNLNDPAAQHGTYGGGLTFRQLLEKLSEYEVKVSRAELAHLLRDTPPSSLSPQIKGLLDALNALTNKEIS